MLSTSRDTLIDLDPADVAGGPPCRDVLAASGRVDFDWSVRALRSIEADQKRAVETPLVRLRLPCAPDVDIHLKDESAQPSGSLKHRLARSLFVHGLCNGKIRQGTTIVEASSGSTAVSVAYFAERLGLPFVAVMPRATSRTKIEAVLALGGEVRLADGPDVRAAAEEIARGAGGVFLDQFTHAERVIDWRGGNIASALFDQMTGERHPVPAWIVVGIGAGGTAATLGRYVRFKGHASRLCAVDVERSAYFEGFSRGDASARCDEASRIEGIGRPRLEPSFIPEVIDRMIEVPDVWSLAGMRVLSEMLGRKVGGSTGANFFALCRIALEMRGVGEAGSIVSLICDSGDRYLDTYYDDGWLAAAGLDCRREEDDLKRRIGL